MLGRKENSLLWEHCKEVHGGTIIEFQVEIYKTHNSAFNRQIKERVIITNNRCDYVLNRKQEHNGTQIPTLLVEVNGYICTTKRAGPNIKDTPRSKNARQDDTITAIKPTLPH